jgi:hypothetical protein
LSIPKLIIFTLILCVTSTVQSADFSYSSIEKRYSSVALSESKKQLSEMQGECLIGLKNLNFRKKKSFDAVAEWTSFRSISLLEQFPPCEVLIMIEVAYTELKSQEQKDR